MLGKKFTIIGGSGGMGKVFGRFFKKHGFAITLFARNENKLKKAAIELSVNYELSLEKSVKNADIVMISIPINSTPDMIRKIAPLLKENAIVFDITSLKYAVFKALTEIKNNFPVNCISLHPMFGPGIKDMKNYFMMVLRVGGTDQYDELINELLNLFKVAGLIITETLPEIHDKRIALTLGVPHMLNILFLNLLRSTNEPLNEFLDLFEKLLHQYKKIIEEKNVTGFSEIFSQSLEYSKEDNYFENSYKYFYEFMNILKRENKK